VEDGVSILNMAYVGDAHVGEKTNIGAGTITCNYDGKRKHRTVIGKRTFIGSHTTLVAPVAVGDGAFTAAGTVVTQDVPVDALAVGRARQANKEEWARRRREMQTDQ
jgi:bifunctional UDP-N-acetylglucosamine pyrophosphorylase/glucosamine-1-phosphate N-acetyltransferase